MNKVLDVPGRGRPPDGVPPPRAAVAMAGAPASHRPRVRRPRFRPPRAGVVILVADVAGLVWPAAVLRGGRLPVVALGVVGVLLLHASGLYRPRLHLSLLDELPTVAGRTVLAGLLVGTTVALLGLRPSVASFVRIGVAAVVSQLVTRWLAYKLVRAARLRGHVRHPTLIVGGGETGAAIASILGRDGGYGLDAVGFLDSGPPRVPADAVLPRLGPVSRLPEVLRERRIGVLVVAYGSDPEASLVDMLRASERAGCEVFVVPRFSEIHQAEHLTDHIGAIPVTRVHRPRIGGMSWRVKRWIDVVVSLSALVVCAPVFAAVALAVRCEVGRGVFFRQVRVGLGGEQFELLKFRTIRPQQGVDAATSWSVGADRIGPVGRLLRRTSLDELPQLVNILRGEMALVGPRPERPHFVERFSHEHPLYPHRHRVPCGLTGLAQVSGLRGDTSIADRARFDNFYIENWSLWLDVRIVLGTVREVLWGRGR